MSSPVIDFYKRPPSTLCYMQRALLHAKGLPTERNIPDITLCWNGMQMRPGQLRVFHKTTGLSSNTDVSILYPHVIGFRLQMALLTQSSFPLSIWNVLQIRNHMVRHFAFDPMDKFDMETRIGGHRFVEKGFEVDLLSRMTRDDECCWQSLVTYYYRGQFGKPSSVIEGTQSPSLTDAITLARFQVPLKGGREFGNLTGDYNGLHLWSWMARRFGFAASFLHPQRVAAMCLARIASPEEGSQSLDLWIKGPVFYGANVALKAGKSDEGIKFGLSLEGEDRSALIGHWRAGTASIATASKNIAL